MKVDNFDELKELLLNSWSKETCSLGLRDSWTVDNPSLGQCAITALVINDMFGGKIMRCMASSGSHYYNMIDDNLIDLTVEQFQGEIPLYDEGEERTREYLLGNEDTKNRYLLLLKNIRNNMYINGIKETEEYIKAIRKSREKYEKNWRI